MREISVNYAAEVSGKTFKTRISSSLHLEQFLQTCELFGTGAVMFAMFEHFFLPGCWIGLAITTPLILKKDWCRPDTNAWYRRSPIPKHQHQASACLDLTFLLKCSCCGMVVLGSRGGELSMEMEEFTLGGKVCLPCDPEVPRLNDSVSMFALIMRSRN